MGYTAAIVTFDGFTDVDVFLAWDLLNRVKHFHSDFEVKILGMKESHLSARGLPVKVHGPVEMSNQADLVFFGSGVGVRNAVNDKVLLSRFRLNPDTQIICSICSGSLMLAALGLLEGLSATTYPSAVAQLRSFGVSVVENTHLVVHGNIATAAGCLASVDLIQWAINKLFANDLGDSIKRSILPMGQGLQSLNL